MPLCKTYVIIQSFGVSKIFIPRYQALASLVTKLQLSNAVFLVTKLQLGHAVQEAPASLALGELELPQAVSWFQAGAWKPGNCISPITIAQQSTASQVPSPSNPSTVPQVQLVESQFG